MDADAELAAALQAEEDAAAAQLQARNPGLPISNFDMAS